MSLLCSTDTPALAATVALGLAIAAQASVAVAAPEACGAPATRIHAIQGAGGASPLLGRSVVVDAVVVGHFPGYPDGLGGFFVQEEDAHRDCDSATSEGLFVFDDDHGVEAGIELGDRVRVQGRVSEFFGLTELSSVTGVIVCPRIGPASAARIRLPVSDPAAWEHWEGMRVRLDQRLVATGHHDLGRFGEIVLAAGGRMWQGTHREEPGKAALALQERNARHRILLDDGRQAPPLEPRPYLEREDGGTLRLGDTLSALEGVLGFGFGDYRIHPTRAVRFEPGATRPARPPEVAGTLRLVAWNLGNHFNGDGRGGGFPTRGPRSAAELERQRAKLVATLAHLDPDVAALVELENDGVGPDSALGQLAEELNRDTPDDPYAAIDPGSAPLGEQAIAVGLLYRPSRATPVGPPAVLDERAHRDFDDARNRPSLAQTFEARATGERVTLVVNHFKSKGSACDAAGDPDLGDGQGDCSATRRSAARALVEWLARDPTGVGEAPAVVAGDLNAYPREDPIRAIESAGYVDLLAWFSGPDAHTYVFNGQAGRLDHALGSADLLPFVGGAAVWHTNADEPPLLDYRTENPLERYAPDPFRASDHDPLLVGLFPDTDQDGVTDARDTCAHTPPGEAVDRTGCLVSPRHRLLAPCRASGRQQTLRALRLHPSRWLQRAFRWRRVRVDRPSRLTRRLITNDRLEEAPRAARCAAACRREPRQRRREAVPSPAAASRREAARVRTQLGPLGPRPPCQAPREAYLPTRFR